MTLTIEIDNIDSLNESEAKALLKLVAAQKKSTLVKEAAIDNSTYLVRGAWSKQDEQTLRNNFFTPTKELQYLFFPNRTLAAIDKKKAKLRSDPQPIISGQLFVKRSHWTKAENKILKANIHLSVAELHRQFFPYRTMHAVQIRKSRIAQGHIKVRKPRKSSAYQEFMSKRVGELCKTMMAKDAITKASKEWKDK